MYDKKIINFDSLTMIFKVKLKLLKYILWAYYPILKIKGLPYSDIKNNKFYWGTASLSYNEIINTIISYLKYEEVLSLNIIIKTVKDVFQRELRYRKERDALECDSSETYDLCNGIYAYVTPRLKLFKSNLEKHGESASIPLDMTIEEWLSILEKMIYSFEQSSLDNDLTKLWEEYYEPDGKVSVTVINGELTFKKLDPEKEEEYTQKVIIIRKKIEEGFILFSKHHLDLWD